MHLAMRRRTDMAGAVGQAFPPAGNMKVGMLSLCAWLALGSVCMAQEAPSVRKGTTEIGVFGGVSHGIDSWRGMGGGNVAYSVTSWLLPYVEYSYFPGLVRQENLASGANLKYATPLSDFHGGVHIRAPIAESKVVPYGVFGFGVVHSSFHGTVALPDGTTIPGYSRDATDPAVNFGGGVRVYVSQKWGFRVEAKAYRPVTGPYSNFFYKAEGGIFYQIH
jgi:hypothetical protein